ncbi:MAG: hypothetical protein EU541_05085 [Promethearchaeota archaeon]|nr:MAG: hypothetical protein EU541_05085 [Candidatus Lokiarchaeota archaeon]
MEQLNEKKTVEITFRCDFCLKEIKFLLTPEEYKGINEFPIIKKNTHGEPEHTLIVQINKNLEIEDFSIENTETSNSRGIPEDVLKKILTDMGLNNEEQELYFLTSDRELISLSELSIIADKPKDRCEKIANKFIKKGLYKKIISGSTYYAPLPPYAALSERLNDFYKEISDIKENLVLMRKLSSNLNDTLQELETNQDEQTHINDIKEIMVNVKNEVLEKLQTKEITPKVQIKEVPEDVGDLEEYTEELMQSQISVIKEQFKEINSKSVEIIQVQIEELRDKLDEIQSIISENLKKLRLGLLEQTIGNYIEKLLVKTVEEIRDDLDIQFSVNEMVFNDELSEFIEEFNQEFITNFKTTLSETIRQLDKIDLDFEYNEDKIIDSITNHFNDSIQKAEQKITQICSGNINSLAGVKALLTSRIENQIEDTIDEFLDIVQMQDQMNKYFWDQTKKKTPFPMRNIWFVNSMDAARAHITEILSKAKREVLLVAPKITDLNMDSLSECPTTLNIRITAFSDPSLPNHIKRLNILNELDNIKYKKRNLQNLWGVNRDSEEILVCILSKPLKEPHKEIEIAGIGTNIQENIKLFAPILEEAWKGADTQETSISHEKKPKDLIKLIKEYRKKGKLALKDGALKKSYSYYEKIASLVKQTGL